MPVTAYLETPMWTRWANTPLFDCHCRPYRFLLVQTTFDNWRYWEQQGFFEAVDFEKFDTLMTYTCPVEGCRGSYNLKHSWEELEID